MSVLVQRPSSVSSASSAHDLQQAWTAFQNLLPAEFFDPLDPAPAHTLYTPWVVNWLLVYQRIDRNATLAEAVDEFKFRFPQTALPDCQRALDRDFSSNTGAYSRARSRMQLTTACAVADHVSRTLIDAVPSFLADRRCFLFDGSSVLLQPIPALQAAFPGARNQHGDSPFPVLHLAVAHELTCGMALRPEYGPMYGQNAVGEIALARPLLQRLPARSIVVADENFGIFIFAFEARKAGHTPLLRLTKQRFCALQKRSKQVGPGRWRLTWQPSRSERQKHPELPADAQLEICLIAKEIDHPDKGKIEVYLLTTEEISNEEAAAAYRQRWNVETDIRDLKRTLLVAQLQGKSVAMVAKEVVMATVAYNLVNQTRRLAAAQAEVAPRRLSFKGVWSILKTLGLSLLCNVEVEEWQKEFDRALKAAAQRKLPERKKKRRYPREVYMRRRNYPPRKSTPAGLSSSPMAMEKAVT